MCCGDMPNNIAPKGTLPRPWLRKEAHDNVGKYDDWGTCIHDESNLSLCLERGS